MAKINIEEIISTLDSEMRRALEDTVKTVVRDSNFDTYELFREFRRNVGRKCATWETVPDQYVEKD